MRKLILLGVLTGFGLFLAISRSNIPTTKVGNTTPVQPAPLLSAVGPLQRLGASDLRLTRRDGNVRPFRFSPDGKLLAGANWQEVKLWTFPGGKLKHDFSDVIDSGCIAFSEDGSQLLALEQREMSIHRFDVETGKSLSTTPLAGVVDEEGATRYWLSQDGRWLCTTEEYEHVTVWDTTTGKRQLCMQMQRMQPYFAPVTRDSVLTLWDDLFLERYDLATGKQLSQSKHYRKLMGLISNADGTRMAAYSSDDQAIVVWNSATGERAGINIPCIERGWRPGDAAISADGKRFVYWVDEGQGVFNRKIAVFDVETGAKISTFSPPDEYSTDGPIISPDGKWVFLSGNRSVFTPVDADSGRVLRETPDHVHTIGALSFTPDGSMLVAGSGDQRCAWNVTTGQPGTVFEQYYHTPYVAAVDNHRALVSGLRNGGIRLQNIQTGAVEREYETGTNQHLARFQLGADRATFVGLMNRTYRRWDVSTGDTVEEWTVPPQPYGAEMQINSRYGFGGLVLGGSRLYRFDQVKPVERLPDGSVDWGRTDLLLEDWTTQRVTNRLPIPYFDHFNVADSIDDRTLAVVTSDDWSTRASRRMKPGSTYLLVWDVATGWERLRVLRPRPDYFSAFSVAAITSDTRLVATGSHKNRIEIWNGFTGELLQRFDAANDLTRLAFSDDGKILASGHLDGSIYLWDTQAAWNVAIPKTQLDPTDLKKCWGDLAGDGSAPAKALQGLLGDPVGAVEMLENNLQPTDSVPDTDAMIDSDQAEDKIRQLGPQAIDALYDALGQSKSEETTARINRLINSATSPVLPPLRRRLLAIGLAERIGSDAAVRVLEKMAMGTDIAPETQAAAEALRRLKGASR